MPDISMCHGGDCPKKLKCYRHRAVPSPYQSYFVTPPVRPDGTCAYFADLRKGDDLADLADTAIAEHIDQERSD